MKIAIHGKIFSEELKPTIKEFFDILQKKQSKLLISDVFTDILEQSAIRPEHHEVYKPGRDLGEADVLFTLGGDGTLLEAVTHIGNLEIPILGINTGRLGFLATTSKDNIASAIDAVLAKDFTYDNRTLIKLTSNKYLFSGLNFALNDFTILKKDSSSMIVVNTYLDGDFLNSYWADGIIVSTPTGSTGYNLSCGGPLVLPHSNNFIITPVSPHSLTLRPMVVSDASEISFEIKGRDKNFLVSLDSRFETVDNTVRLTVSKEDFKVKLIKLEDNNIFETMRQKLNWGLDVRN